MSPEALEEVIRNMHILLERRSFSALSINAPAQLHHSQRKTKRDAAVLLMAVALWVELMMDGGDITVNGSET